MTSEAPKQLETWASEGGSRQVTVRELLSMWGAKRRSFQAVDQISRDLRRLELRVDPPIVDVPIDEPVTISPISEPAVAEKEASDQQAGPGATDEAQAPPEEKQHTPGSPTPAPPQDVEVRMKVSWIPSAKSPVASVSPDADFVLVQSRMLRHDYSQLAVQAGPRSDPLAVSWESIAKARLRNRNATMKDATEPAECVSWDDDLLPLIPRIIEKGFVFVRGRDRTLDGIVTTADLSKQFEEFANPFLMLGEIERGLRVVLDDTFTPDELAATRDDRDSNRSVESAADLTMGEILRLLERPAHFEKLGWMMDRKEFIAAMRDVNALRNDVMHFSPDAIGSDELLVLRNFQQMLQKVAPQL